MEMTSEQVMKLFEDLGSIKTTVHSSAKNIRDLQGNVACVPEQIAIAVRAHETNLHPEISAAERSKKFGSTIKTVLMMLSLITAVVVGVSAIIGA